MRWARQQTCKPLRHRRRKTAPLLSVHRDCARSCRCAYSVPYYPPSLHATSSLVAPRNPAPQAAPSLVGCLSTSWVRLAGMPLPIISLPCRLKWWESLPHRRLLLRRNFLRCDKSAVMCWQRQQGQPSRYAKHGAGAGQPRTRKYVGHFDGMLRLPSPLLKPSASCTTAPHGT